MPKKLTDAQKQLIAGLDRMIGATDYYAITKDHEAVDPEDVPVSEEPIYLVVKLVGGCSCERKHDGKMLFIEATQKSPVFAAKWLACPKLRSVCPTGTWDFLEAMPAEKAAASGLAKP